MSKFIVIEGLIGVGKTTLCRLMEERWSARLVLEPHEDNPFLASFYADPKRYAFPTQMFYLASRTAQQVSLLQGDLFSELVVADYLFAKDRLFAEQTLNSKELKLYDRIAGLLKESLLTPEFVLFLDSPTPVLLDRIKRRAINAEQSIPGSYLDQLREAYYRLWDRFDDCPVYVMNTGALNYVDAPEDAELMLDILKGWIDGKPHPKAPKAHQRPAQQLSLFDRF